MFLKFYGIILKDLEPFRDQKLGLREFRSMLCRRHSLPKRYLKHMEFDLQALGYIKRKNGNVYVHWPLNEYFRKGR